MKQTITNEEFEQLNTKTTKKEFDLLKHRDEIELNCRICNVVFKQTKGIILKSFKNGCTSGFCSRNCSNKHKKNQVSCNCEECGKPIVVRKWQKDNYKHSFCSYSCSATYRNKNKTTGFVRSKIEMYIEKKIRTEYPQLSVLTNDRLLLNGLELDFYFPKLKLGIELNGITHYEPIYGLDRLTRSLDSDHRKMQLCYEQGVELAVIDVSTFKYFTEACKTTVWNEVNKLLFALTSSIPIKQD